MLPIQVSQSTKPIQLHRKLKGFFFTETICQCIEGCRQDVRFERMRHKLCPICYISTICRQHCHHDRNSAGCERDAKTSRCFFKPVGDQVDF